MFLGLPDPDVSIIKQNSCDLFITFIFENYVNVPSKSKTQKSYTKNKFF
jgi:hypothetical protein